MKQDRRDEPKVHSITSAPQSRSESMAHRQKVYVIQMAARLVLFVVTVATWGRVPVWASLTIAVGAVVLPYTAVLLANEPSTSRGTAQSVPRPGIEPPRAPRLPGGDE